MTTPKVLPKKPWNDNFQKRYDAIYSFLTKKHKLQLDKDNFIKANKKLIFKLISEDKDWSEGTKESYLLAVGRYLNNINDKRGAKMFGEAGIAIKKKRDELEGNNELDAKEMDNFRHHDYFVNLINGMQERAQDGNQTETQNMKYLLLVLLTYQPPLRTSFYTSAFIIGQKKDNDGINNYILMNRRGGKAKAQYIVNKDKASNYKNFKMNKNLSIIDVSPEATTALNESLLNFPRFHLFEINGRPISQSTLLSWLREITGVAKIDIDIMRSSYITWYHEQNPRFIDREKLSKIMRHSQSTALRNYKKVFDSTQTEANDCSNIAAQKDIIIRELQTKLSVFEEQKPNQLQYNKKRRDVLFQLNKFNRKPRQATIDKYNLKSTNGKYL